MAIKVREPEGCVADVSIFCKRVKSGPSALMGRANLFQSAATLIAIGGRELLMGMESELGPLDVQMYDQEKDAWGSALDVVQSFERLNAYALTAYDQAMQLFGARTRKRPLTLMPLALQYATSIVGPMADKIDTLEVTGKSRELKVAEDYAIRIMRPLCVPRTSSALIS